MKKPSPKNTSTSSELLDATDGHPGNSHAESTRSIKDRQKYLLWGMGACLIGGILVYGWISMRDMPFKAHQEFKSSLTTGSSRINPQEAWVYQFTNEAEVTKKRLEVLEGMLGKLLQVNQPRKDFPTYSENTSEQNSAPPMGVEDPRVGDLRDELKAVHREEASTGYPTKNEGSSSHASTGAVLPPPPGHQASHIKEGFSPTGQGSPASMPPFRSKALRKISLSLRNARNDKRKCNIVGCKFKKIWMVFIDIIRGITEDQ